MPRTSGQFTRLPKRIALIGLAVLAALGLLATCAAPFAAPSRNTIGFNAGLIADQLGSRSLSTFEKVNVVVQDASGNEIYNQTITSAPTNNQVTVELDREADYHLVLAITNRETTGGASKAWIYETDFTVPAEGGVNLEVVLPSLAEWNDFQAVATEIGKKIGFSSSRMDTPMYLAKTDAQNSSATSGSGTLADGSFSWAWSRADGNQDSPTFTTVTCLSDQVLGTTGYILKASSIQEFGSSATQSCKLDWTLEGGVITTVLARYYGGGSGGSDFTSATVNGFDFKAEFIVMSSSLGPGPDEFQVFFKDDLAAIQAAFGYQGKGSSGPPVAGTPFSDLVNDKSAVFGASPPPSRTSGSGVTGDGKFRWEWTSSTMSASTHLITVLQDISLPAPATHVLKAGSVWKEYFDYTGPNGSGTFEYNYQLSGPVVQQMKLKHQHNSTMEKFVEFSVNGKSLMDQVVTVTVMDGGSVYGTFEIMKGSGLFLSPRYGYNLVGLFRDAAFTVPWTQTDMVDANLTLYGNWTLAQFAGGSGTMADPYQVSTPAHLDNVRLYPSAYFTQTNPIDLGAYGNWTPIPSFSGYYNGQNYEIKAMTISGPTGDAGFFTTTNGANLVNMFINIGNINSGTDAKYGLLVGSATSTNFTNCQAQGSIVGVGIIGLLVGHANGGTITACRSYGWINSTGGSTSYTGGLVGRLIAGSVSNCFSAAKLNQTGTSVLGAVVGGLIGSLESSGSTVASLATSYADCMANNSSTITGSLSGGLIGKVAGSFGLNVSISDSYATGVVSGSAVTGSYGGLIGQSNNYANIDRCFSAGPVSALGTPGGFIGAHGGCSITKSFWDMETSRVVNGALGTGLLEAVSNVVMLSQATFTAQSWNFAGTWTIQPGSYPHLSWQGSVNIPWAPPFAIYSMESSSVNSGFGMSGWDGSNTGITYSADVHTPNMGSSWSAAFDGSTSNIMIATHDLTNVFTFVAWVKLDAAAAGYNTIFSNMPNAGSGINSDLGIGFVIDAATNNLEIWAGNGGVNRGFTFTGAGINKGGPWAQLVVVFSGSNLSVYVNKVQVGSTMTFADTDFATSAIMNFGRHPKGVYPFKGLIDDARIYNRALSPAEINTLY